MRGEIAGIEVVHGAPPSTGLVVLGRGPGAPQALSAVAREWLRGVGEEVTRLVLTMASEAARQPEPAKEIEHFEAVRFLDQDASIFGGHEANDGGVGTVEVVEQCPD